MRATRGEVAKERDWEIRNGMVIEESGLGLLGENRQVVCFVECVLLQCVLVDMIAFVSE